jgi:hypothetical protein
VPLSMSVFAISTVTSREGSHVLSGRRYFAFTREMGMCEGSTCMYMYGRSYDMDDRFICASAVCIRHTFWVVAFFPKDHERLDSIQELDV